MRIHIAALAALTLGAAACTEAEQVAALVEEGKCAEARRVANEAGDRQMALRVRQTCR